MSDSRKAPRSHEELEALSRYLVFVSTQYHNFGNQKRPVYSEEIFDTTEEGRCRVVPTPLCSRGSVYSQLSPDYMELAPYIKASAMFEIQLPT